ncbi:MAG: Holliday junction branch migration protein RuvA [SAR324 cluster bacterium]|nr:Holliday junction branch migration protein RuvA [SAR324 cluster bacterium]
MIAYLEGRVLLSGKGMLVIKTDSGVGYKVHVTQPLLSEYGPSDDIALHTHTHVRDDELTLYGFAVQEEKDWFEMLIKTTGVGPKLGLAILSALPVSQLTDAVLKDNMAAFSQVSGIGRKTAAKLCLDLRDHLKNGRLSVSVESRSANPVDSGIPVDEDRELASALKNMGYQEREIRQVLHQAGDREDSFEVRLKKALSLLAPLR